jgi:hypothetical protein
VNDAASLIHEIRSDLDSLRTVTYCARKDHLTDSFAQPIPVEPVPDAAVTGSGYRQDVRGSADMEPANAKSTTNVPSLGANWDQELDLL